MIALLRAELPEATFVIVAHREPQGFATVRRVLLGGEPGADTDVVASAAKALA